MTIQQEYNDNALHLTQGCDVTLIVPHLTQGCDVTLILVVHHKAILIVHHTAILIVHGGCIAW